MNNVEQNRHERVIIRISNQSLAIYGPTSEDIHTVTYEPYVVKSGMSMAANLREAFRENEILVHACAGGNGRVQVLLDSPVLLVPIEEYNAADEQSLYHHAYPGRIHEVVLHQTLSELNCVALFAINKDIRMVITDNFRDVRIYPLMLSVWSHFHHRAFSGNNQKLYAYFHDHFLEIFSFQKNRFRFCNSYKVGDTQDATYFILFVWQQLAMNQKRDELYVIGEVPDDMRDVLHRYLSNVFPVKASSEFNRAPITQLPHVTYDVVTHVISNQ